MATSFDPIERSVLACLAYFDVFDYPVTVAELWRWMYAEPADVDRVRATSPREVELTVRKLERGGQLERTGEFVSLPARSWTVATRMSRKVASRRKWNRATLVARCLRFVPFVRFVGVVNTLALDNARPESDIDFFIVMRHGRLWLGRLLVTSLVHLLGIRRHGRKVANRICLSYYVSDRALSLASTRLGDGDPHLAYWVTQFVPLFDRGRTFERFRLANGWAAETLPHGFSVVPAPFLGDAFVPALLRSISEVLLGSLLGEPVEALARLVQKAKMQRRTIPAEFQGESSVIVTNDMLKFHERDRRRQYREAFRVRLGAVSN